MNLANIFVRFLLILISINNRWAYADDGADADGYPIVQFVTDRQGMIGLAIPNTLGGLGSFLTNFELQVYLNTFVMSNYETSDVLNYLTKNASFYVPITQGGASENGTVLSSEVDITDMIASAVGYFIPPETGSYTFKIDYIGTMIGFIIRNFGTYCAADFLSNVDPMGNLYFVQDMSEGPDYTSGFSHTVTLTAGQTYNIGYYYINIVNTTFHSTQPAVSVNFTMTLPNGEVVRDLTDYIRSGHSSSYPIVCQYNETDSSLSTWSESYTSTYSTYIHTVTPQPGATGTDAITRVVESYYVLVPSSTYSSVLYSSFSEIQTSSSTSNGLSPSAVISSFEIQSSSESSHFSSPSNEFSIISSSLSASSDISSIKSTTQDVPTLTSSVESIAISSSQTSSPSSAVTPLSSVDFGLSTIISTAISSSSNDWFSVSINGSSINNLSGTGDVAYSSSASPSLIPGTSSFPHRIVISANTTGSSTVMTSSVNSTLSITSEIYHFQSVSASSMSMSVEHTTSQLLSADSSQLSGSPFATSAGTAQFRNVTKTSEHSSRHVKTNEVTTQTYTDWNGATITTVVPCAARKSSSVIATSELSPSTSEESVLSPYTPTTPARVTTTLSSGGDTTATSGNFIIQTDNNGVIATKIMTDCNNCTPTICTKASHNTTPKEQLLSSTGIQQYDQNSSQNFGTAVATSTPILYSPANGNGAVRGTANIISLIMCVILFS